MKKADKTCLIIRSYDLTRDSRVRKIIDTITPLFSNIENVYWDRDDKGTSEKEHVIPFKFNAPFGKMYMPTLPLWWLFLMRTAMNRKWDVAYAINTDSVIPMLFMAKVMNRKIIYDVQDTQEDMMVLPSIIKKVFFRFDRAMMKRCDGVVLVDDLQKEEFGGIPNKDTKVVYDSPPDQFNGTGKVWSDDGKMLITFVGAVYRARKLNIDKMIDVVLRTDGVQLRIAGYGDLSDELTEIACSHPDKIEFLGKVDFAMALRMLHESDATFVLRDPDLPIYRYISGSTMVNAMMCGIPLIVNKGTATAIKVEEKKCGIIVDANDPEAMMDAITVLKRRDRRVMMGENARKAYLDTYGWHLMRERLLELMRKILDG